MPVYSKTTWVDGSAPSVDATNLNKIEEGIFTSLQQDGSTSMTGQLFITAGTVGTPSISPTGDSNTGMFFPAADTIAFGEGGTEAMRITSAGNVGIGTISPTYKLHVNESDTAVGLSNIVGLTSQSGGVFAIGVSDKSLANPIWNITTGSNEQLAFLVGATEKMRITSAGNVGIGTTNPSSRLTIAGTSEISFVDGTQGTIETNDNNGNATVTGYGLQYFQNAGNGFHSWQTSGNTTSGNPHTYVERMRIDNAGNVGVGITNPLHKLDVDGTIRLGGNSGAVHPLLLRNGTTGGITINTTGAVGSGALFQIQNNGTTQFVNTGTGNVGIGVTTPSALLHVVGTTVSDFAIFESTDAAATPAPDVVLFRNSASPAANDLLGNIVFRGKDVGGNNFNYAEIAGVITDPTDTIETGQLRLYTGTSGASTEKMRITSTGSVGINTLTNPAIALDVTGTNTTIGTLNYTMRLTSTATHDTAPMAGIAFAYRYDSPGNVITGAGIAGGKENGTDSDAGSVLRFFTRTNAATVAERMRVTSAGYLLIGYTTSNGTFPLQVNGQIFATNATIATSDARYKENVTSLSGALDLVKALNPVQFDWKQHTVHNFNTEAPTIGFIAQEVAEVLKDKPYLNSLIKKSECTWETETGEKQTEEFLGIAESNLIAILTKAIQELTAKVEALEAQINK